MLHRGCQLWNTIKLPPSEGAGDLGLDMKSPTSPAPALYPPPKTGNSGTVLLSRVVSA